MSFNFKKNIFIKTAFVLLVFFIGSKTSLAFGRLFFTGPSSSIAPGGEFVVSLMLDMPESINAIDLEVDYPKESLEFLDFNNAGSIVDFWQPEPTLIQEGKIKLSGGVISGFKGNSGLIVKIYFKATAPGNSNLNFGKNNLYLADGKGTTINPSTPPFKISVVGGGVDKIEKELEKYDEDTSPPVITLTSVRSPKDKTELVVFNVVDKESGIKETQMRYKKYFTWSEWKNVQNPVVHPGGAWVIELQAQNNAGLYSVSTIKTPMRLWGKFIKLLLFIFLVNLAISQYNKWKSKYSRII